jgi:hypothetical protein
MATKTSVKVMAQIGNDVIELEGEELAQFIAERDADAAKVETEKAEAEQREIDRAALLAQLGITEEQAKLLLG